MRKRSGIIRRAAAAALIASVWSLSVSMAPETPRTLEFIPETYDFGTIREDDGKVSGLALAVNVSGDTTVITTVRTSCGCTGASYTDRVIAPGDTAEITFTYNPANRPGRFEKTIKVFTGSDRVRNDFTIKGNVIANAESLKKAYPYESGGLRLSTVITEAGKVKRGEMVPLFVGLYNPSEQAMTLKAATDSKALEASLIPEEIPGGELGALTMVVKPRKMPERTKEFRYNAYILDAESGDTLVTIPVGGCVVP